MRADIKAKIGKIRLLAFDVDGVLTAGTIIVDHLGRETKVFDVQDGFGLVLFKKAGFKTAIITAKSSPAVKIRARRLGIDRVYQDAYPKVKAYRRLLKDLKMKGPQVCYVGDDLPDLPLFPQVGFSVAVANAVGELKAEADYVTRRPGGHGAVREVVELILKTQKKWTPLIRGLR